MAHLDEKPKADATEVEVEHGPRYTAAQIQHRFETLRGLSQGEMEALNKKTRRIIDWRLMPAMTGMVPHGVKICKKMLTSYSNVPYELPRQDQRLQRSTRGSSRGPSHVRYCLERRYIDFLRWISDRPTSGEFAVGSIRPKMVPTGGHACLEYRNDLYASNDQRCWLLHGALLYRIGGSPVLSGNYVDHIFVVY